MRSISDNIFKTVGFIFIIVLVVIMFFPYFIALITSFKSLPEIYTSPPTWIPREFNFKNYTEMFGALPIGKSLLNSLIIAIGSSVLALVCALPAGYVLSASGWAIHYIWFSFLLGWLAKRLVLNYGGISGYRRAVPFFVGLTLGEYIVGSLWTILQIIMGRQTYVFFLH